MMDKPDIAQQLTARLGLDQAPIALAFVESRPEGVSDFEGVVPSACSFWPRAQTETFFASAEQHYNCPVGAMTMGFDLPQSVHDTLMGLVQKMCLDDYLSDAEPASIPSVDKPKSGIVYGPLAVFPLEPEVVLVWLAPEQAMLYNEAAGSATWSPQMVANVFGRPTCAALPVAINESRPTMSFGCIGMRTFTGAAADALVAAVPAGELEGLIVALERTAAANAAMLEFYVAHKESLTS